MESGLTIAILAAGLGTRMKSRKAKLLHRAGGRTLAEHVAGTALELAPRERVFAVTGYQAEQVEAALARFGVGFIRQTEQKGTGHALLVCRERLEPLGGLLVVLYGDCPLLASGTLRRLVERQHRSEAAATVITTVLDDPTGYGRIVTDAGGNIRAIVEQKAATPEQLAIREINSGIYCFRADLLWKHLAGLKTDNPAGEYYLTDVVEIFRANGHAVATMRLDDATEVLGINTRAELAAVDRVLRARKARQLMLDGVTIEQPETVLIDEQAGVGQDTVIEPFAQLRGETVIGADCRIGACSIIENSTLADGVEVRPFTTIADSRVETGAIVGPYARLRMGCVVEAGARVGNFVELKKTRLGAGAKSNHLAYLGDAVVGAGANIGAGTITCNYDGERKHQTRIGEQAFVGSNATLVAPVEIGDGGYVAAGSVVTETVPPGSLALGRARQVNKEGWVAKRKARRDRNPA